MWGPYSRTPYARSHHRVSTFEKMLAATYTVAAALTSMAVVLITLLGLYYAHGFRIRFRPGLKLTGKYKGAGKVNKHVNKGLAATYLTAAALALQAAYLRTLAATYTVAGILIKRLYLVLLASTVFIASRLRLMKVLGFEYSGDFEPGDIIKINTKKMTVTINGENALDLISGRLPLFNPGANELKYSDNEGSRTVKIKTLWRGRRV